MSTNSGQSPEGSITVFLQELQAGDEAALKPLCDRFFPRLLQLARQTLGHRFSAGEDAEDAVQSAIISFWQGVGAGQFSDGLNRNGLWKLLAVITTRKTYRQLERALAEKRGGGRVRNLLAGDADDSVPKLEELASVLPTQELDLVCKEMTAQLPDDVRPFAVMRLLGYRNREIAERMNCTERKVERKLQLVRIAWTENLDG